MTLLTSSPASYLARIRRSWDENGEKINTNLQTAFHVLGGVEFEIGEMEFNVEPWYKKFTRTIELNRLKQTVDDADYQAGFAEAYGADLSVKYVKNRFYLWGVVSYQNVKNTYRVSTGERDANNNLILEKQTFPTPFDRRVNINLLGSYTLGKKKTVEVSLRYNYGSPFPFTQTQGFYEQLNMTGSGIGANYPSQNGQVGLIYANDINGGRLSNYHRIDVSAKKKFKLSTFSNIEASINITNVANRNNIFYVDRIEERPRISAAVFPEPERDLEFLTTKCPS